MKLPLKILDELDSGELSLSHALRWYGTESEGRDSLLNVLQYLQQDGCITLFEKKEDASERLIPVLEWREKVQLFRLGETLPGNQIFLRLTEKGLKLFR